MPPRGQSGASLVIVLAFMTFVVTLVPAILAMSLVGVNVRADTARDTRDSYAAASGIEAAVRILSSEYAELGEGTCEQLAMDIDATKVVVDCQSQPPPDGNCAKTDQFYALNANVYGPDGPDAGASVAASVVIPSSGEDAGTVIVAQWANGATVPLKATPVPCGGKPTTTTTTT
ncbi:MAG: hypothetical protein ACK5O2_03310, partial [Microthrixaceae bacterium]